MMLTGRQWVGGAALTKAGAAGGRAHEAGGGGESASGAGRRQAQGGGGAGEGAGDAAAVHDGADTGGGEGEGNKGGAAQRHGRPSACACEWAGRRCHTLTHTHTLCLCPSHQVEEMRKELSRTRGRLRRVSESNRSMAAAMRSQASGVEGTLGAGAGGVKGRARSMTQLPAVERRGRSASRSRPASGASWASGRSAQRSASATRRGRRGGRRDPRSCPEATVPTVPGDEPGPEDQTGGGEEKVRPHALCVCVPGPADGAAAVAGA